MTYNDLSQAERDRLRAAYEAGFCTGACAPWMLGDDPAILDLVDAVAAEWFQGLETRQAAHRPAWPAEPMPEWFRAAQERQALPDSAPIDWIRATNGDGRP